MDNIDFKKGDGLVPAIIQDAGTQKVLMMGYMNEEALEKTRETRRVTFYSRSKQQLWVKGEQSGNFLQLVGMAVDCDGDTLLVQAIPTGPVCHTGTDTCWGELNSGGVLLELEATIADRKAMAESNPGGNSYVASLFDKGTSKIAQKVGEEAVETVIEALQENDELFLEEAADLLFHYLILLQARDFRLEHVLKVLEGRRR